MHLKFLFSVILVLTKRNGFVVLCENRIRIMLQMGFKIIFLSFPFFTEHLFLFCFACKFLLLLFTSTLHHGFKHRLLIS